MTPADRSRRRTVHESTEFRALWARHDVRGKTCEAKLFHHAEVGDLELHYEALTVNSAPSQNVIIYLAEAGSPSADALALLGSLNAVPTLQRAPFAGPD